MKYPKSDGGNPLTRFPNMVQTSAERREKYNYLLGLGYPWMIAQQRRDWRWSTIQRFLDIDVNEGILQGVKI